MADALWDKAKQVFIEAAEKPCDDRAEIIRALCGDDDELRGRVETLLQLHDQADEILVTGGSHKEDGPQSGSTDTAPPAEALGAQIGPYKLLQQIGEGGFGAVYMAEQTEPVVRKVALKIIKLGMDTKQTLARFDAERQALALMDHPNIAGVLDAGATDSGRPYFVMELVKGVSITQYCDTQRLRTRDRLDLFIRVCNAVQHAHQKGIIHRDIKPSNVMITLHDGKPVPKVIDFGIAKATGARLTEKTLFTEYGQLIGTPAYMSPEQAEMSGLDIDTRSDIYSLGVLLYELLTGMTPFDAARLRDAGYEEMRRIIREEEPPKPSTRLSGLLSEPRTPVRGPSPSEPRTPVRGPSQSEPRARASGSSHYEPQAQAPSQSPPHQEPIARAPGSSALSAPVPRSPIPDPSSRSSAIDIAKHRRSDPASLSRLLRGDLDWIVMKCLDKDRSRRYETANGLAMDIQRHLKDEPVQAGPPSAAYRLRKFARRNRAGLVMTGVVTASLLGGLALATLGFLRATQQKQRAETKATEARRESAKFAAVNQFLQDMLAKADPSAADNRRDVRVRDILDEAARQIDEGSLADQPAVEAAVRTTIAKSYLALGMYETARRHLQAALRVRREQLSGVPADVAMTLRALAAARAGLGEYAASEILLREALAIVKTVYAERSAAVANILRDLAMALKDQAKLDEAEAHARAALEIYRRLDGTPAEIGDALNGLARLLIQKEDYQAAEQAAREAVTLLRDAHGDEHPAVMSAVNTLAIVLYERGSYDEAEHWFRKTIEIERELIGNEHPDLATGLNNLAALLFMKGEYDEAEELYREALAIQRRALGENHPSVGMSLSNIAHLLFAKGDYAGAESQAREAVTVTREARGGDHPSLGVALDALGQALQRLGRFAESEKTYRQALAIQRAAWGDGTGVAVTLANLAQVLADRGEYGQAIRVARESLEMKRAVVGPMHVQVGDSLNTLGAMYFRAGDLPAAEPLLRQALEIRRKVWGAQHPDVANSLSNLAWLLNERGKHDQAIALQRQALSIQRKLHGPENPSVAMSLNKLGVYHFAQGNYDEAEPYYDESLPMTRKLLGDDHPQVANILSNLALLHRGKGDLTRAETFARRALTLRQRILPEHNEGIGVSHDFLATVLIDRGNFEEAERHARDCLAIREKTMPGHWLRHSAAVRLAEALARQSRFDEAEPMLLNAIQEIKPPGMSRRKHEALRQIIKLYEAWGKAEQAAPWRAKLEAMETKAETPEAPAEADGFDK